MELYGRAEDGDRLANMLEPPTRRVGWAPWGPDCVRDQLDHLSRMSRLDTVSVQILPNSVAVHDGIGGGLTLLDFADTQSIGKVEYPDGAVYVGDYHQVAGYHYRREQPRADALDADESREAVAARRAAMD